MTEQSLQLEATVDGITIQTGLTGLNDDFTRYKDYDIEDLKQVFDKVCDQDDWKAPIAVWVPGEAVMPVVAAIEFMTATHPSVQLDPERMRYLIESEGYRN